jgi:hypothetical protein
MTRVIRVFVLEDWKSSVAVGRISVEGGEVGYEGGSHKAAVIEGAHTAKMVEGGRKEKHILVDKRRVSRRCVATPGSDTT